jgi:serine/threonine protein kinase
LGKGTFGKVFDGLNIFSKDNVALKIFEKSKMNSREDAELTITNEIINLERLRKYHLSPLI